MDYKTTTVLLLVILCSVYTTVNSQNSNLVNQNNNNNNNVEYSVRKISQASEQFALDIFKRIVQHLPDKPYDFMISPFSLWSLLVLVYEGARGNTLAQLQRAIRLDNNVDSVREGYHRVAQLLTVNTTTVELTSQHALFYDKNGPINQDFEKAIRSYYKTDLVDVDLKEIHRAQEGINSYVKKATKGLIDYVVNAEDLTDGQLVMISTIFFKGQWTQPFNRSLTRMAQPFYNDRGQQIGTVNLMYQKGPFAFALIPEISAHAVEIPYGIQNRLSMVVILPKISSSILTTVELIQQLGITRILEQLTESKEMYDNEDVEVYLPRFSTTTDFTMNAILEEMGVVDLFHGSADLTGMTSSPVYLSRLFHKTKIDVNEEGTVAAGISGAIFQNKITPPVFLANRPFLYLIIEKTSNSLLFCGQIVKGNLA